MSLISNFEAEVKAFVIKVLEDLDLYHPPVVTAQTTTPATDPVSGPVHIPGPTEPTTPPNKSGPVHILPGGKLPSTPPNEPGPVKADDTH